MADRRIDQLTEAEDISDDDLFVIWKENISQTRSIAKGTMNLASKSYVDNLVASRTPDWESATAISVAQIKAGYTAPSNGMLVGGFTKENSDGGSCDFYINGVWVTGTNTGSDLVVVLNIPVSEGDRLTFTGRDGWATNLASHVSFVSFKQIGE